MPNFYFLQLISFGIFLCIIFILSRYIKLDNKNYFFHAQISWLEKNIELIIFILSYLIFFMFNNHKAIIYNNYSWLAKAILEGHIDIPDLPNYLESISFMGKKYMHLAPGPAILCLPFVALFGLNFRIEFLCFAIGASNAVLFYKILQNININKHDNLWLTVLAVFGTVNFWLTVIAHSWFFGQITGLLFVLLGLYFITLRENKKIYLSGLCFGIAVTCRMSLLFGFVFFTGYIILKRKDIIKNIFLFISGMFIPGVLYFAYNYIRFGTIMDMSYYIIYLSDYFKDELAVMLSLPDREQLKELFRLNKLHGGPLQLRFAKNNLYSIFLLMPEFKNKFPYVIPTMAGVCITLVSPALWIGGILACIYKRHQNLIKLLIITSIITAVPFILNDHNGFNQFGMRYSMDFMPYLFLLSAIALTPIKSCYEWKIWLILYCVFANAWGIFYWNNFYL